MNRAVELGSLGRFGEAKAELEECLQVFQNDPAMRARVLSSLATLFDEQGDVPQAIAQQRRALALCEQLPDPRTAPSRTTTSPSTSTAAAPGPPSPNPLVIGLPPLFTVLSPGWGRTSRTSLHNYAIVFRRANAAGSPLVVPRLDELLANPAFHPLKEWLRLRQADVAQVQAAVDGFLEQARQMALKQD